MFRRSRQKIVALIMVVLVVLLAGTLCVIYSSSYAEVYHRNQDMLEHHIELFSLEGPVHDMPPEMTDMDGIPHPLDEDAAFQLSTFYSVVIGEDGGILQMDNDSAVYSDDELAAIAQDVARNMDSGTQGSLLFRCGKKDGYTVVAFMDNTILQESISTLFRYTMIFGLIAIAVIYFLACRAARWIVKPLEESYLKQKQFISDAGHELKTPVSVISANTEILAREIGANRWLDNIQHENARMSELIRQLLDLVRTEQVAAQLTRVDLSRTVNGEALPFESVAFEKGLTLQCDVAEGVCVMGDGGQLAQLTSILLDNAIRHSKAGHEVKLKLTKERSTAVLSVVNEGEPIPAEQQKLLFERFYRADEARTGSEGRYGLGLAIAKAIVMTHKGKIDVICRDGLIEFRVSLSLL